MPNQTPQTSQTTEPEFHVGDTPGKAEIATTDPFLPDNSYDLNAIARNLYEDSGIEWPETLSVHQRGGEIPETHNNPPDNSPDDNSPNDTPPPVSEVPQAPEAVTINGRLVPADQANAMMAWYDYLANNPDKASRIAQVINNQDPPPVPQTSQLRPPQQPQSQPQSSQPQQLTPPPDFDLEDPNNKWLLDQLSAANANIAALHEAHLNSQKQQIQSRVRSDMDAALTRFKNHYKLTDDEILQVRQATAALNITPGLVEVNRSNPQEGIYKALEIGMYQIPSTRDKAITLLGQTPPSSPPDKDTKRKQSLSALSSPSGSTPRTESRPRLDSDHAMKLEIAKEIAKLPEFSGNNGNNLQ